jgi:glycine/D-amino acid oxidase-like deaminating enzyme
MQSFDRLTKEPEFFDSFTKTVIKVNNLGKDLWRELVWEDPNLFKGVCMQEPIAVFFLDTPTFKSETIVEIKANPIFPIQTLSPKEIAKKYPAMVDSVSRRVIVGGLVLDGFSLNSISFCRNMIKHLGHQGVDFSWGRKFTNLDQNDNAFDYYLISTGVSITKKVMGVAGVWIKIPNPGLKGPIKIATPYPTGYINGTIEGESLLLSGGYGFIGQDARDEKSPGIQTLFEDMKRNVRMVFPESYKKACEEETLDERVCVRPMKASGLGVFEVIDKGVTKVIFTGANGAGGFTQAPVVARSVLDIINGKESALSKEYSSDIDFLKSRF